MDKDILPNNQRLFQGQQRLLDQLKRGHRFFLINLGLNLLTMLVWIVWIFLLFGSVITEVESDFFPFLFIIFLPTFFVAFRQIGPLYRFLRKGGAYLRAVEHSTDSSEITGGITSYINLQLAAFQSPNMFEDSQYKSLSDGVRSLVQRLQWMPLIMVFLMAGVVVNFWFYSLFSGTNYLTGILIVLMWIGAFLIVLSSLNMIRWRRQVKRWLKLYTVLESWGANLEATIRDAQPLGAKGGASG